eukprot:1184206-Prorocentrum_minimum.AAC.1
MPGLFAAFGHFWTLGALWVTFGRSPACGGAVLGRHCGGGAPLLHRLRPRRAAAASGWRGSAASCKNKQ